MLSRLVGDHIEFSLVLDSAIGRVRVDPGQLDQVLMNLAVNARDAMPHGGRLRLATRNEVLDHATAARLDIASGSYVVLSVSDTGFGMAPNVIEHIFEPFFTTKGPGTGTGLGLATVFGIVRQSGGAIQVSSEQGAGSTFNIYLPLVTEAASGGIDAPGDTVAVAEAVADSVADSDAPRPFRTRRTSSSK